MLVLVLILQAGADSKLSDLEQRTPLHYAVANSCVRSVRVLLDTSDSALNLKDSKGRTPLHCAVAGEVGLHTDARIDL